MMHYVERSTKERIEGPGPSEEEGRTNMYRCLGGLYEKRRRKRNGDRVRTGVSTLPFPGGTPK